MGETVAWEVTLSLGIGELRRFYIFAGVRRDWPMGWMQANHQSNSIGIVALLLSPQHILLSNFPIFRFPHYIVTDTSPAA
jgi:hypothetical protein